MVLQRLHKCEQAIHDWRFSNGIVCHYLKNDNLRIDDTAGLNELKGDTHPRAKQRATLEYA